MDKREAALSYVERGWNLVPLNGKVPKLKGWPELPPTTEAVAIDYSKQGNIGIRTGKISNLAVIDVDLKGLEHLPALKLPLTPRVRTGSGGLHLYFRYPEGGLSNSTSKIVQGIDVKAEGGQVVAPPSIHSVTGESYVWEIPPDECPLADFPEPILTKLRGTTNGSGRDLKEILRGVHKDIRNVSATSVTGLFFAKGLAFEEVLKHMRAWGLPEGRGLLT